MKVIRYIEHILTFYEKLQNDLDLLYKEAGIFNIGFNGINIHGFSIGPERGELYLHTSKTNTYEGMEEHFYHKLEYITFLNRYSFSDCDVIIKNNDALISAIELIKREKELYENIKKNIRLIKKDTLLDITPVFKPNNEYIELKYYKTKVFSKHLYFYIRDKKFETVDDFTWNLIEEFEIPDKLVPQEFLEMYENKVLHLNFLTDEEKIIHKYTSPSKTNEKRLERRRRELESRKHVWPF